jgi:hypothetical protein
MAHLTDAAWCFNHPREEFQVRVGHGTNPLARAMFGGLCGKQKQRGGHAGQRA